MEISFLFFFVLLLLGGLWIRHQNTVHIRQLAKKIELDKHRAK